MNCGRKPQIYTYEQILEIKNNLGTAKDFFDVSCFHAIYWVSTSMYFTLDGHG